MPTALIGSATRPHSHCGAFPLRSMPASAHSHLGVLPLGAFSRLGRGADSARARRRRDEAVPLRRIPTSIHSRFGPFPLRRFPAWNVFPLRPRSGQCACATAARRSGFTSTTSSRRPGSGGYSRVRVLTVLTTTPSRPPGSRRYSQHSRRYRRLVSRPHRHRDCAAATRHVGTLRRRSGPSLWFLWQSTPRVVQSA